MSELEKALDTIVDKLLEKLAEKIAKKIQERQDAGLPPIKIPDWTGIPKPMTPREPVVVMYGVYQSDYITNALDALNKSVSTTANSYVLDDKQNSKTGDS